MYIFLKLIVQELISATHSWWMRFIEGANFQGAQIDSAIFEMQKIRFRELRNRYAAGERNFSGFMVERDDIAPGEHWDLGQFKGLDLSGIILRNSNIQDIGLYMEGVILRGADLTRVDLGESNFEGADLSNAILRETRIFQSVFELANLSGADLTGAGLTESSFFYTNFSRAKLNKARISNLHFVRDNLTEATFKGARFLTVFILKKPI